MKTRKSDLESILKTEQRTKGEKMEDQELNEHDVGDFMWCVFVDDEEGNEIYESGFIHDTEEAAFIDGAGFGEDRKVWVISDFEQNKKNEEAALELLEQEN